MKKIISILLSLALLLSALCPSLVFASMSNVTLNWSDPTNWIFNDGSSKNIGTNEGAVAYTGGNGVTVDRDTFADRGTTLKLDSGSFYASLPLNTEKNTKYKLTFSYYTDKVGKNGDESYINSMLRGKTYAFSSAGIFIPNHPAFEGVSEDNRLRFGYTMTYLNYYASNFQMNTPAGHLWTVDSTGAKTGFADQDGDGNADGDVRTYKAVDNYHGIEVGKWYTISFKFNSRNFKDIAFTLQKIGGANMWLDDVTLTVNNADYADYFEEPSNWAASVQGSNSSPCKNILVDGISDTTVATAITWANYSNSTETVTGNGSSLLISNPNHVSHIKLPDIETGATYRLKFAYKPTGGNADANVLNFVGIFDPEFTQSKITSDSALTYSDLKTGFVAVDGYTRLSGKRYRFENGVYASGCDYASVLENTYTDEWRETTLYFTAKENLDNLYLLISYTTGAGKLLVDDFEFEKVEKIPDEFMPGGTTPTPDPEEPGDYDSYFETPSKWGASVGGSNSYPCKNILVNGISDTTVATSIGWAKFTNESGVTANGSASSLLISNPNHVSHIKLPDTEVDATYRLKFAYKPTGGTTGKSVLKFAGIFDPEFLQEKISTDSTIDYLDLKNGFSVVDSYAGRLPAGRYRFTNGVYPSDNSPVNYGKLNNNIYNENDWQYIEFYFTVTQKLDNPYLLISYTTDAGKLYVDDFEFEKVDEIPISLIPGYRDPNYVVPTKHVIDFNGDPTTYASLTSENVEIAKTKDHNKNQTSALHIKEVRDEMENVTFPGWSTVSQRNDPVFTLEVEPGCNYTVSFWMKIDKYTSGAHYIWNSKINVLYDWRGTHASSMSFTKSYSDFYTTNIADVWKQYTFEFCTEANQNTATFAINAGYSHPSIWIDDIVYEKVPAGFVESTNANYCESPFNLALSSTYGKNAVFTKKKTVKFSLDANTQYVFGVNLSGKGTFTLAWDEDGANVIKTYDVTKSKKRIGGVLITDNMNKDIYVICDPNGSKMSYKDFYFFRKYSIGSGREMGYEDNVDARKPVRFTNIPTVSGNSLEEVMNIGTTTDNGGTNNSNSENGSFIGEDDTYSPSTGDSLTAVMIITITFIVSAATVMLLGRRKKIK